MEIVTLHTGPPETDYPEEVYNILFDNEEEECPVCFMSLDNTRTMTCCNKTVCSSCYIEWHLDNQQPTCVFCRQITEETLSHIGDGSEGEVGANVNGDLESGLPPPETHKCCHTTTPSLCVVLYVGFAMVTMFTVIKQQFDIK